MIYNRKGYDINRRIDLSFKSSYITYTEIYFLSTYSKYVSQLSVPSSIRRFTEQGLPCEIELTTMEQIIHPSCAIISNFLNI